MDIEHLKTEFLGKDGLSKSLGIEYLSTPEPDTCAATMPVDERNCQPFGFLSGGASLSIAESLAGVGSLALCPDCLPMGINISGNHVKAAAKGETVKAVAKLIHKGSTIHQWQVSVMNSNGELVSNVLVTNIIVHKKL
ncbi:MAG: PaaI family thioesterase [Paludibacteraceae bacterium]|nr:PaaI family thioesterase [Paludibacteraceae bacterium]